VIARLRGQVVQRGADHCVIDVGGVGYLVHATAPTLAALPAPPAAATLLIETHLREDALLLYGFAAPAERDWFRLLTTVQGVGAKVALAILATLPPGALAAAIAAGDRAALTRAPGVGAKLAARLLTELRERAGAMSAAEGVAARPLGEGAAEDALSALLNLGYRRPDAQAAVARAAEELGAGAGLDALIRASLRLLAR
jgi:Holliday junction DNA helicase RuvA